MKLRVGDEVEVFGVAKKTLSVSSVSLGVKKELFEGALEPTATRGAKFRATKEKEWHKYSATEIKYLRCRVLSYEDWNSEEWKDQAQT